MVAPVSGGGGGRQLKIEIELINFKYQESIKSALKTFFRESFF